MTTPTPAAPAAPTPTITTTPPAAESPSPNGVLTQADVDRIVSERVARERAKYADYAEMKAKATEYDKALEAAKTEQQKAVEVAQKAGYSEALAKANTRLVKAEARALAAAAKFRDPADAVAFLQLDQVKVDDDGNVDAAAVKAALDELAKIKPYLLDDGKPQPPSGDIGQGHRSGPPADPRVADLAQIEADINAHKRR